MENPTDMSTSTEGAAPQVDTVHFVETIIARYRGPARIQRLQFFLGQCQGNAAANAAAVDAALTSLVATVQAAGNVNHYQAVFDQYGSPSTSGNGGPVLQLSNGTTIDYDNAWVASTRDAEQRQRQVLQSRLRMAQSHLNKEAIRVALVALAQHDYTHYSNPVAGISSVSTASQTPLGSEASPRPNPDDPTSSLVAESSSSSNSRGGTSSRNMLQQAASNLQRSKDYCTTRQQTVSVNLLGCEVSWQLRALPAVQQALHALNQTIGASGNTATAGMRSGAASSGSSTEQAAAGSAVHHQILVLGALERLASAQDFEKAAHNLSRVCQHMTTTTTSHPSSETAAAGTMADGSSPESADEGVEWETVLAPEDIALYAGVLTLVTGSVGAMEALAEPSQSTEQQSGFLVLEELAPIVRDCLLLYRRCRYKECYQALVGQIFANLQYDVVLAPHVATLTRLFFEKCLIQYWKPYLRVPLSTLTTELSFGFTEPQWLELVVSRSRFF